MSQTKIASQQKARKHGLMLSLLGLLILIEVITVAVVLASQRFATDRALKDYTYELLQNVVDETRENAVAYLRQAEDAVSLSSGIFESGLIDNEQPARLERLFLEQLRVIPQLDALYFGDAQGNFIFSKRDSSQSEDGFLSKLILTGRPTEERVLLIGRDAGFKELSRRFDPNDHFDPRLRPWYQQASGSDSEIWTDPYIFYTSQQPGLTVARRVVDTEGNQVGVIGADIELSALSEFLSKQRIGTTGAAFIIYSNGDVLAHPNAAALSKLDNFSKLRLKRLSDLDAITAEAGSRLREKFPDLTLLKAAFFDAFQIGETRFLSMFVPLLSQGGNQWVMGVYAPEDEFARTIREGQHESVVLGVAVSLLTMTAAVLFALVVARPINALQQQAREDPLTGLLNRRSFDENAERLLAAARRTKEPISAIMIDIDTFKPINDEYGHAVGDEVLLMVARRISRGVSRDDLLSRYGGEEFALLLLNTPRDEAEQIAERLRCLVSDKPMTISIGSLHMTISLGVAEADDNTATIAELLDRADRGLLAAKRDGRNRVVSIQD